MKTSFLPKNNKYASRNKNKKVLSVSILVLLFILAFFTPVFKDVVFAMGKPIWIVRDKFFSLIIDNKEIFKSKLFLISENNSLKEKIKSYENEKILTDIVRKENDDLKSILNRGTSHYNKILSAVLVKPYLSPYDTLIIDMGKSSGVSVGDKVIAFGSNYIGYIGEIYEDSSKVILYSSYGEKIKVLIGQNNILKEAIGVGSGNFSVQLPKEADVKEGDIVSVPSISSNIFAVVEKVESKENDSFEYVLFKSTVNMTELKWVEVLLSNKK